MLSEGCLQMHHLHRATSPTNSRMMSPQLKARAICDRDMRNVPAPTSGVPPAPGRRLTQSPVLPPVVFEGPSGESGANTLTSTAIAGTHCQQIAGNVRKSHTLQVRFGCAENAGRAVLTSDPAPGKQALSSCRCATAAHSPGGSCTSSGSGSSAAAPAAPG